MSTTAQTTSEPPKWVRITGGKHKGKTLRFVKFTDKRIGVENESGKTVFLLSDHVSMDCLVAPTPVPSSVSSRSTCNQPRPVSPLEDAPTWVRIRDGKHKGKILRFIKRTSQRIAVQLSEGSVVYLLPDHVDMTGASALPPVSSQQRQEDPAVVLPRSVYPDGDLSTKMDIIEDDSYDFVTAAESLEGDDENNDDLSAPIGNIPADETSLLLTPGDLVCIQRGVHARKKAIFVKYTPNRIAVKLEGDSKTRYLFPNCLDPRETFLPEDENDPMVRAIREQLPASVRIKNVTDSLVHRTLFGAIYKDAGAVFFDLETNSVVKLPHNFTSNDRTFFISGVKLHDKAKSLTCTYLPVASSECVASHLLQIGAFEKLIPRKTGARLELLLSTAAQADHVHALHPSDFALVPEKGNVGCGFISRRMINRLLGNPSPDVCALQVRIVIPSMGIFKGMLMEKPGIETIELPPSMRKVDAATTPDGTSAWLMINQTGIYPYTTRIEQEANSFQDKKEFPTMARWMLTQKGVSQTYLQRPNGQHSNLVGVADPTDSIPPGCVFVTGIRNHLDSFGEKVIVSRYPMTEASDGRLLPIVRDKPQSMSTDHWNFLCSKPFGVVIFGNPEPGDRAMPEKVAQGDLDGDGYFVTWDPTIVHDAVIGDHPIFAPKNPPSSPPDDWWTASSDYMTKIEERKQSQRLVGRLHDRWFGNLLKHSQQDAVIFGRAYKDALVVAKHGGRVSLPRRLWSQIPHDLRHFLRPPETAQ